MNNMINELQKIADLIVEQLSNEELEAVVGVYEMECEKYKEELTKRNNLVEICTKEEEIKTLKIDCDEIHNKQVNIMTEIDELNKCYDNLANDYTINCNFVTVLTSEINKIKENVGI